MPSRMRYRLKRSRQAVTTRTCLPIWAACSGPSAPCADASRVREPLRDRCREEDDAEEIGVDDGGGGDGGVASRAGRGRYVKRKTDAMSW